MRMILYGLVLIFFMPLSVEAQPLLPPIRNYKIFEYNAAPQNWGMAINDAGELFVANNKGLLYFNGAYWTLHKLPNNTIIRSVAILGNKIYTGSYEEFGYWEKNDIGALEYTSLTYLITEHTFTSEEFWQILFYKETVVFRSFSKIYCFKEGKITIIDPDITITSIASFHEMILVAGDKRGLFQLKNDTLIPLKNQDLLTNKTIVDMAVTQEGLLVGTKLKGCYLYKNEQLSLWDTPVNNHLKQHQLNRILSISADKIVFGTIKNGVYLYDTFRKTIDQLNRETGLQNNTVLSLIRFKEELWIGLDNGIDRVQLHPPIQYYTDPSGVLGTVYDIAVHDDILYLGSNTGIYYIKDNSLHFVEGSQGHVWDLEVLEGELFCGHNTGTFKINQGILEKASDFSGGYAFVKVPEKSTTFLQGIYTGIAKYKKDKNGHWQITRVLGIDFPVKQLCFENPTTLWVAHPYKGYYRLTMNTHYDRVINIEKPRVDSLPNLYNIKLYNIKNQIIIYSEGGWYRYDPILDAMIPFKAFEPFIHKELIYYDERYFWFIDNESTKSITYTDLKDDLIIAAPQLRKRLVPDAEHVVKQNDSIYFISLSDGFGQLNLSQWQHFLKSTSIPEPRLEFFKDKEKRYSLHETPIKIPYKNARNINVQVAALGWLKPRYYYELQGRVVQSSYTDKGNLHFQHLPHGNYILSIATVSVDNKKSTPKYINFEITPPWYLSKLSIGLYFLIFLGIVGFIRKYNTKKIEKQHHLLKQKLQREQEEHLLSMEKEKLSREIKQKQKELARTTLNVAHKNKIILEVKSMLLLYKDVFSNQQRYRVLLKKLEHSIKDDSDWKRFEVHFRELHEDFFENLLRHYPLLTPKDLKLCAYLKMNLSSKEIAPLMAISIRGVEIHRYRLRKKLCLEGAQNLSNFLITFK